MSLNPYSPPTVEVADERPVPEVPAEILKKIKGAWVAAVISGSVTAVFSLVGGMGLDSWSLLDAAFIFGLAYGIYRKSRACAVLMLVYFIVSKVILTLETGKAGGLLVGLIFLYYYARGVVGTFAYRKFIKG